MDFGELRARLTAGSADNGRPSGLEAAMSAISMVSTEVGRLDSTLNARLDEAMARLAELKEHGDATAARLDSVETLSATVTELSEQIAAMEPEQEDPDPIPRPWNWADMGLSERIAAIDALGRWLKDTLFRYWPHSQRSIPWCWSYHPELLQDLSLLYVAYEQAYVSGQGRYQHAWDFRRILTEISRDAQRLVKDQSCPKAPGDQHMLSRSRDDTAIWRRTRLHPVMEQMMLMRLHAEKHGTTAEEYDRLTSKIADMKNQYGVEDADWQAFEADLDYSRAHWGRRSPPPPE